MPAHRRLCQRASRHDHAGVMTRIGLPAAETLIVEDNDHGIAAAKGSGGHLLVVGSPSDVTYERIREAIAKIDQSSPRLH